MKLKDAIIQAIEKNNAGSVGRITDYIRFNLGFNYNQTYNLFNKLTGINKADFDQLLYECDYYESANL